MNKLALIVVACLSITSALAADLPVLKKAAAPATVFDGYPYNGSGFYWGLNTFGEAADIGSATPAGNGPKVFAVGAAAGVVAGYVWGRGTTFYAVEGMANYSTIGTNGTCDPAVPCVLNARWSFEQRVKFGGPIANMLSFLPDLSTVFPALPAIPAGSSNPLTHPYVMAGLHEDDVSAEFGLAAAHKWRIQPSVGVGVLSQMSQGIVMDVWAEYIMPVGSFTVAPGMTVDSGKKARVGLSILY